MRPRKVVLVYSDPMTLPLLRMPLEIMGHYCVVGEDTEAEALVAFKEITQNLDLALVIYDIRLLKMFPAVRCMKAMAPHVPVLLIGTKGHAGLEHCANMLLTDPQMSSVLDVAKVMTTRKRGPRLGYKRPVRSVDAEMVNRRTA